MYCTTGATSLRLSDKAIKDRTTPVVHVKTTVTDLPIETYLEQFFDGYAELQEHDRDVHDFCTICKRSF